jgi:hypothetical protein
MDFNPGLRAESARSISRRWFFRECGVGLASIALTSLLARAGDLAAPGRTLAPRRPHFAPKAKRVIFLFMGGAPSHIDLFDAKPELTKRNGQLPPESLLAGYRSAFIKPDATLLGPKFGFSRYGQCGMELSELLPHLGKVADDVCFIRSMQTDAINHAPGQLLMNTGSMQFGRPSLGAWSLYGLGSETENLPGFVVLSSAKGSSAGSANWGCGFMPAAYAGVPFRATGDPVLYLSNPPGIDAEAQRDSLDSLRRLNEMTLAVTGDPATQARIEGYEMAYRLQASAPELMETSREPESVRSMYGDVSKPGFARNCLLARRLAERGVRFVQLFHEAWDQHGNLQNGLKRNCADTDQPAAALIADLKQRGMLDDTLVVWGGEFGRTPMAQGTDNGRDHHNRAFTMWLAGGGVKRGFIYGQTDEIGFSVVENPVHVHDLHATILHLLGFDHERLTFRSQGRDFRLTDVAGRVVGDLLV